MRYLYIYLLLAFSCGAPTEKTKMFPGVEDRGLGNKFETYFNSIVTASEAELKLDSNNVEALANLAEAKITNWLFGFSSRKECMPLAVRSISREIGRAHV